MEELEMTAKPAPNALDPNAEAKLELSLYENAVDSLQHAVEHYISAKGDLRHYKYALLHLAQGVALLLKERLRKEHWSLIYSNVADDKKTVDVDQAIARIKRIAGVDLGPAEQVIQELAALRNRIEHYAVQLPKQQVDSVIGRVVPFLASFTRDHLQRNLRQELGEATWSELLRIESYFQEAKQAAQNRITSEGLQPHWCDRCQSNTAMAEPYPAEVDPWILNSVPISCLVCLSVVATHTYCRQCGNDIILALGMIVNFHSYCENCSAQASEEFPGFRNPKYVAEVKRWFETHDVISHAQLVQLVLNVSTAGSSRVDYAYELLDKRVIDFVHEYQRKWHLEKAKETPPSWAFSAYDEFKWIYQPREIGEDKPESA